MHHFSVSQFTDAATLFAMIASVATALIVVYHPGVFIDEPSK